MITITEVPDTSAKFLLLYLGKGGFLDGKAGFTYTVLQAIYEYFIVLKVRELEEQNK